MRSSEARVIVGRSSAIDEQRAEKSRTSVDGERIHQTSGIYSFLGGKSILPPCHPSTSVSNNWALLARICESAVRYGSIGGAVRSDENGSCVKLDIHAI